jgi:1-acyl-sn-glycerol-3-phosphate acyltransferase
MPSSTSQLPGDLYPDHLDLNAARHEQDDPRAGVPMDPARAALYSLLIARLWIYRAALVRSVKVLGRENIEDGARILVSNHAHVSDAFLLPFIFHRRTHSLAQEETFTLPVLGKLLKHAGQIPVRRGTGSKAALVRAADLLAKDKDVLIYPEGVLTHGGEMRRGLTGAARLSHRSRVPMQPVGVFIPEANTHIFHGHFYNRPTVGCWQFGGPAVVAIGKCLWPFPPGPEAVGLPDFRLATDLVMQQVRELVDVARLALA